MVMPNTKSLPDLFRSVIMLTVTADQYVLTTPDSRWGKVKGFPQSESLELGRTIITSLHVKEQQSLWSQDLLGINTARQKKHAENRKSECYPLNYMSQTLPSWSFLPSKVGLKPTLACQHSSWESSLTRQLLCQKLAFLASQPKLRFQVSAFAIWHVISAPGLIYPLMLLSFKNISISYT